jgi:hypothetical protein
MSRKNLDLPKDLVDLEAVFVSQGECRFCNKPSDVVSITRPDGADGDKTPIVLHAGRVCGDFTREFSKSGATGYADQLAGIHHLG